jgi:hypothetical protein
MSVMTFLLFACLLAFRTGSKRLGGRALLSQILPPILGEVQKRHHCKLNGKQDVDGAQALPTHELVCVQPSVDVVESQKYPCSSKQPVGGVPDGPGTRKTWFNSG